MAWSKVDEDTFNINPNDTNETVNFNITAQQGDLVVYVLASDAAVTPGVQTSGYTDIATDHANINPGYESGYKFMGETPDTGITFQQASTNGETDAGVYQIWRGGAGTVDSGPASTTTETTGHPDPPSITTNNANSLVVAVGMLDDFNEAANKTAPTGYTNLLANDNTGFGTDNATSMIASLEKASPGVEDPGVFGGGTQDAWAAGTIAFDIGAASETPGPTVAYGTSFMRQAPRVISQ